jgi:hypothetical protein
VSATVDQVLTAASRFAGVQVLFVSPKTIQFQTPPHERPGGDEILLLRQREGSWGFPIAGDFDHPGEREPWAKGVDLVRLDERFIPPGVDGADFFWASRDFALAGPANVYTASVLPALRRFDSTQVTTKENATMADRKDFVAAQSRAEALLQALGDSGAPPFVAGEGLVAYRARLATQFQKYAPKYKNVDLNRVGDASAFEAIEDCIYADAAREAEHPTIFKAGELRAIRKADPSGRVITKYVGDPNACWDQFNPGFQYARRFLAPGVSRV